MDLEKLFLVVVIVILYVVVFWVDELIMEILSLLSILVV